MGNDFFISSQVAGMERSGKDLDHFMQEALREAGLKEGDEVKKTKKIYFP